MIINWNKYYITFSNSKNWNKYYIIFSNSKLNVIDAKLKDEMKPIDTKTENCKLNLHNICIQSHQTFHLCHNIWI